MNNFNNDLSLCITCYDKDYHLLNKTLSAFQRSTEAPNEIIIISSGIKTENLDIYTYIKINNSDIPIFSINSEKRHNQATARNKGAKASSCKFIMFFDVDDIPHPQKIEITKKAVLQNDLDAVIHDYSFAKQKFLKAYHTMNLKNFIEKKTVNFAKTLYQIILR